MKTYSYSLLVVFITLFFSYNTSAQKLKSLNSSSGSHNGAHTTPQINPDFCGTDFFHNQKMKNDIKYKTRHVQTLNSIKKITSKQKKISDGVLQVPVVVHVMHKGESIGTGTNISDEDVKRGIRYLNNYWRKIAGSKGVGDGVDMQIEFALAIQDDNGNCTNGIDRVDMSGVPAYVNNGVNSQGSSGIDDYLPRGSINSLKEYSIWDPTKYYNVWIVDEIDNKNCFSGTSYTAGYAFYASSHGRPNDGSVVLICSYLNESNTTWAHEMGHAFNLPHTFDGDNPSTGTCGYDGIADTPKHIRTSSDMSIYRDCGNDDPNTCHPTFNQVINPDSGFERNTGTHQDHMHNYMDYTGCPTEFTGGQRAVANAALNNIRASFLTSQALIPPSTATVYFTSTSTIACKGNSITFTDDSTCTPNTYTNGGYDNITFLWTFDNGIDTPYTSTEQNPTIAFNNSGTYDVTLSITNVQGTTSLTKTDSIVVSSGAIVTCPVSSANNGGNYGRGVTSVSFNTLSNTTTNFIPSNALQDFTCSKGTMVNIGAPYDLDVRYRSINRGAQYLEVWIDWDNNGRFNTSNTNGINELVLTDNVPANSAGTHTASASVTPPATVISNTLLRMRVISGYNKPPAECGNGLVQRADDYGVFVNRNALSTASLSKPDYKFKIYPNPVKGYLYISLENNDEIKGYQVYDISGKEVMFSSKITKNSIEVSDLSKGFYFLKIKTDTRVLVGKFIKE